MNFFLNNSHKYNITEENTLDIQKIPRKFQYFERSSTTIFKQNRVTTDTNYTKTEQCLSRQGQLCRCPMLRSQDRNQNFRFIFIAGIFICCEDLKIFKFKIGGLISFYCLIWCCSIGQITCERNVKCKKSIKDRTAGNYTDAHAHVGFYKSLLNI